MANTRFLFVYGTLMSTARGAMGRSQRARLQQAGRIVGPAAVFGRLYDLGSYPGLVVEPPMRRAACRVFGELYELVAPAAAFAWLDRYEGIDPARPLAGEYLRTIDRIELFVDAASVRTVDAWVYVYRGALGRAREIPHGTWES